MLRLNTLEVPRAKYFPDFIRLIRQLSDYTDNPYAVNNIFLCPVDRGVRNLDEWIREVRVYTLFKSYLCDAHNWTYLHKTNLRGSSGQWVFK